MGELVIQTHNFENAKNQIKKFSDKKPEDLALKEVDIDGGLFNLFDHKVTGNELNTLTAQIQKYLIKFNELHGDFIKEFGQVYTALEVLDKEYIQAIFLSIKAAEEASNKALKAQEDIFKTIEIQKQTLSVLRKHKEILDKYEHLKNIDEIWKDAQVFKTNLDSVNDKIDGLKKIIELLTQYQDEIRRYTHLKDIDQIWNTVHQSTGDIRDLSIGLDEHNRQINALNALMQAEKRLYEEKYEDLRKKLTVGYALAGGAVGLSVIHLILNLIGIM